MTNMIKCTINDVDAILCLFTDELKRSLRKPIDKFIMDSIDMQVLRSLIYEVLKNITEK